MPTKVLDTSKPAKPKKPRVKKAAVKSTRKPKRGDPWLRDTRREEAAADESGRDWLPKEKSRNWLK